MEKILNLRNTVIFVTVSVLWKIFLASKLCLHPDEAYYWFWSKKLELSYYDHSPMIAYFIKITTLFSDSELAVRASGIITILIVTVLIWKLVMRMFDDETVASASVMLVHSMPIVFSASFITTPDTPSLLFLSLSTFFFWKFIENENKNYWYAVGLFFGLALLSKYTAVLFLAGAGMYVLFLKKFDWFKHYQLYIGLLISFVCFLPVLYWNYNHDWFSFSYQLGHGLGKQGYRLNYIFEYLGSQMMIFNFILFLPAFFVSFKYLFSKDKKKVFLASMALSTILFYLFTALKKSPEANWPMPAYFTFAVICAKYFTGGGKIKRKLLIISMAINVFLSVFVGLHAVYTIVPMDKISKETAKAEATNWFYGYDKLADKLMSENIKYVLTPSHQLAAEIAYYSKNKIIAYADSMASKKSQYNVWGKPVIFNSHEQGAFVYKFFDDEKSVPYGIDGLFKNVSSNGEEFKIIRHNITVREFMIRKVSN